MFEYLIWLVPLGVAVLGAWRPQAGLVALAATLPFFGSPPGGPYLGAFDAAGVAVIVTCWRRGRPSPSPLAWPALAVLAVGLTSLVPSPYLPPSWRPGVLLRLAQALPGVEGWPALYTWRAAADLLLGWGLFLSVRRVFAGRSVKPLAIGFLAGLGATVLFGFAADSGLLNLDAYRPRYGSNDPVPRLASLFFLSGWLAEYIVVATPLALAAVAAKAGRRRHLLPIVLALALGCLALARQRGAWLAAALQIGVAAAWLVPRWRQTGRLQANLRRAAFGAVIVLVLTGIVVAGSGDVGHVVERAVSIRGGPTARLPLWRAAGEMFQERPVLGWGIGAFAPAYDVLHPPGSPGARPKRGTAHNLYLQTAAETGVLGLAALAMLGWAAANCVRRPRQGAETIAAAVAIALIGVATYGLVQQMFYLRAIAWAIWLLLGCAAVVTSGAVSTRPSKLARALALTALALVPVRLAVVDSPPLAASRSFGFHEPEGTGSSRFRWSEKHAAVRLASPEDGTLTLAFANGHPKAGARPVTVAVGIDGENAGSVSVAGGWETHSFEVGARGGRDLVLTLDTRPTFRPFSDYLSYPDLARSKDIRSLGVAVKLPADLEPASP